MPKLPASRVVISIALLLLFFVFLVAVLFVTNLSFSVWEQLQQKPDWLIWSYILAIVLAGFLFGRIVWHFLLPAKKNTQAKKKARALKHNIDTAAQRLETMHQAMADDAHETPGKNKQASLSRQSEAEEETVAAEKTSAEIDEQRLNKWSSEFSASPELAAIKADLQDFARRKSRQTLYVAIFGDISSGKSSVINALIAEVKVEQDNQAAESALIETSVLGGTTREVKHYHWQVKNKQVEQALILTDMPGLNEQFAQHDLLATEEVLRAHIVVYLCDADLTASQFNELKQLVQLDKPCIVAINKADRYSPQELSQIVARITQRLADFSPTAAQELPVLTVSAGGMREFIRLTPDGKEERVQRSVAPEVGLLQEQLLKMMQTYGLDRLEQLREKSVAQMLNRKLDDIEAHFKRSQSHRMVQSYTKKAIVASMATISPGTDLLVQGYLGIQMIKDLCKLYDVNATDIDANKLIELVQSRMNKTLPLLLAIAGNGLKSFPGIGTVTGGLMHAVAYGMIFDTLGHSVARTLEVTGELSPVLISDLYKEQLSDNIESRTKHFIKLVLNLRKSDK